MLTPEQDHDRWLEATNEFRRMVLAANDGKPVDKIFGHTGGLNFPLLLSALAEGGTLAFFGGSPSGQHWCDWFLKKDPEQSSFLTLLRPL